MIISTSSHNLRLTEDICEYVESAVRDEFGHVGLRSAGNLGPHDDGQRR